MVLLHQTLPLRIQKLSGRGRGKTARASGDGLPTPKKPCLLDTTGTM